MNAFDYQNIAEIEKELKRHLVKRIQSYTTEIFVILEDQHDFFFQNTIGPNRRKWPDLEPETWARKQGQGMLRESDILYQSLTSRNEYSVREVEQTQDTITIVFGTNVEYSIFLHNGTNNMPARPHIGITRRTADRIGEL